MLKLIIYSYQGGPKTASLQCFFCYLMKVEPFFVLANIVFGSLVGPLWWWAPGHCPNAHRVSPSLKTLTNFVNKSLVACTLLNKSSQKSYSSDCKISYSRNYKNPVLPKWKLRLNWNLICHRRVNHVHLRYPSNSFDHGTKQIMDYSWGQYQVVQIRSCHIYLKRTWDNQILTWYEARNYVIFLLWSPTVGTKNIGSTL